LLFHADVLRTASRTKSWERSERSGSTVRGF
jgi:hypothetical protein